MAPQPGEGQGRGEESLRRLDEATRADDGSPKGCRQRLRDARVGVAVRARADGEEGGRVARPDQPGCCERPGW